jgi:UTP--glucose-1-phosphate uridylyltransferase
MSTRPTAAPWMETMDHERALVEKMRSASLPAAAIDSFVYYYRQLLAGETGLIPETAIEPIDPVSLPTYADLEAYAPAGRAAAAHAVVIKLNGGLGTTMGLDRTKSLIVVKDGRSFLEITVRRILRHRERLSIPLPLLLMNSFRTDVETREALETYPEISTGLPTTFVQHRFPRVLAESLGPALSPGAPEREWSPPGHGDLYPALVTSGLLAQLRARDVRYAFVSNVDNLGAAFDLGLLGYLADQRLDFMMEVAERTPMDRKGGHVARRQSDGALVLRELAQCPDPDRPLFLDVTRHRWFNTNNLWIDLVALQQALDAHQGVLRLPLIRNRKRLDTRTGEGPDVYQLESAGGAAVSTFARSAAVRVPRSRFTPVKTCDDLLLARSDYFELTPGFALSRAPAARSTDIRVRLDPRFYARLDLLEERFPFGPPSLIDCRSLTVDGDVVFGKGVRVVGDAHVSQREGAPPLRITDDAVLTGAIEG